jgi:hypothetical protein
MSTHALSTPAHPLRRLRRVSVSPAVVALLAPLTLLALGALMLVLSPGSPN